MSKYFGYVGTYTNGESEGIYSFILHTDTGKITNVTLAEQIDNPCYLSISRDQTALYTSTTVDQSGGIASFSINQSDGSLHLINMELTKGTSPCHVSVNQKNEHIVAAYYHQGCLVLNPIHNRKLQPISSVIQHEGSGPNEERQEQPHVHFTDFTPDGQYVVAIDLGTDELNTYTIEENKLKLVQSLSLLPGCGPRHMVFHPNGKYAYVLTELSNEIITLSYNRNDGSFKEIQYNSSTPLDYPFNSLASAIRISSDGRFIYTANRGHNSIAVLQIDEQTGKLTLVEHVSTEGDWPRDFSLDPSEKYLIVSNQKSNNLVLFTRDLSTGKLTLLQSDIIIPEPTCVKFISK